MSYAFWSLENPQRFGGSDVMSRISYEKDFPGAMRLAVRRALNHELRDIYRAMGIDRMHQIDTGLDPVTAEREQWDDGNNTLALAPRVAVAYERNDETNARLEDAGIEVVRIAGSELGSGRGGPRCMSCPVSRDPLPSA